LNQAPRSLCNPGTDGNRMEKFDMKQVGALEIFGQQPKKFRETLFAFCNGKSNLVLPSDRLYLFRILSSI